MYNSLGSRVRTEYFSIDRNSERMNNNDATQPLNRSPLGESACSNCCIFNCNRDRFFLCSIKGTESKILDENVYYFEVYGDVAAYYKKAGSKDGLYDVYMSEDGENFTLCVEQAAIGGKAS